MENETALRYVIIALSVAVGVAGGYHRLRAARTKDKLDRRKEGSFLSPAIRILGVGLMMAMALWMYDPSLLAWAGLALPWSVRWAGLTLYAAFVGRMVWMYRSLGTNITDTVETRRDAYFVSTGP